jgi:hypothetical protein
MNRRGKSELKRSPSDHSLVVRVSYTGSCKGPYPLLAEETDRDCLTLQIAVVKYRNTSHFSSKKLCNLKKLGIYIFPMILRIKSDYFLKVHYRVSLCNRDMVFSVR